MTLKKLEDTSRNIYLYDTFKGMTEPGENDFSLLRGQTYEETLEKWRSSQREGHNLWGFAPVEQVKDRIAGTDYPMERVHFVEGDVRETIPNNLHDAIALLRLDTNWYELTKHELNHMYALLSLNGILICDDFTTWDGASKAVNEFFQEEGFYPYLHETGGERLIVKPKL